MSKRSHSGSKKVKYAKLTGYSEKTTPDILKKLASHPHKGDWRRHKKIRIAFKLCSINWSYNRDEEEDLVHVLKTPVPVGMTGLVVKNQSASGRSWESIPVSVKEAFNLEKKEFDASKIRVTVSFSGMF